MTLPSHQTTNNGIKAIKELPNQRTKIYGHVADADLTAAYPSTQVFLNVSKETTYRELSRIKGIPETTQRLAGINLTSGHVNAVEICCNIFNAPNFDKLLQEFERVVN